MLCQANDQAWLVVLAEEFMISFWLWDTQAHLYCPDADIVIGEGFTTRPGRLPDRGPYWMRW